MTTAYLISHTHWDREWYRTFQAFRARLVDAVDRLLDLLAADEGYRFVLDGQTVVVDDYLEIRPNRREELAAAVRAGRVAIGPWYVQPDSLLPSGEAHVRNLLAGRRVGSALGGVSRVGYTPDSFGHPAQLPQLLAGFGLRAFVYWRGNPQRRPQRWRWAAPDGTVVPAIHLAGGYFAASGLDGDERAVERLAALADRLEQTGQDPVILMNGFDHALPDATRDIGAALAAEGRTVRRAVLDDVVDGVAADDGPIHRGELLGAADPGANLLPGVWSSRMPLKLRNRRCEALLEGWAEPWAALGSALGTPDERPALRLAWQALLQNQAHDSICGCSHDAVHAQMAARYDTAQELATETARRVLERIAGLGPTRRVPDGPALDVAVFNPSPWPRRGAVSFPLDGYPMFVARGEVPDVHPLSLGGAGPAGVTIDRQPARLVASHDPRRVRLIGSHPPLDVEFVVEDVPAFGYRRVHLEPGPAAPDDEDDGTTIDAGEAAVEAAPDGTFTVRLGDRSWSGLGALEDVTDQGDTYDFDPTPGEERGPVAPEQTSVRRRRHPSGIQELEVTRLLPGGDVTVTVTAAVTAGVPRVDLHVVVDNARTDHRLRLLFPTGAAGSEYRAATTFGVATRRPGPVADEGWQHPAPATFPHQGWIQAGSLAVAAPGLPEAELTTDGTIAVTLIRSVGWLARLQLGSRPVPAGPEVAAPGAQCLGRLEARLSLLPAGSDDSVSRAARDAELGFWAVAAGDAPLAPADTPLLQVDGPIALSALKPAEAGSGTVLRLLGLAGHDAAASVRCGPGLGIEDARPVRLDETPSGGDVPSDGPGTWHVTVPDHALRSLLLLAARRGGRST